MHNAVSARGKRYCPNVVQFGERTEKSLVLQGARQKHRAKFCSYVSVIQRTFAQQPYSFILIFTYSMFFLILEGSSSVLLYLTFFLFVFVPFGSDIHLHRTHYYYILTMTVLCQSQVSPLKASVGYPCTINAELLVQCF